MVVIKNRISATKRIQIHSSLFLDRVAGEPAHEDRGIESVAVVVKPGFGVEVLG